MQDAAEKARTVEALRRKLQVAAGVSVCLCVL